MEELLKSGMRLTQLKTNAYGEIYLIENGQDQWLLITALAAYIPIQEFKLLFADAGEIIKTHRIPRLIFDKRHLTVFHQPSMEWYFVHWKEEMIPYGLLTHIKLLPLDKVFRTSVQLGRNKIEAAYPHARFHELTISYAESLNEAVHQRF